ncbi:GNAT family N-acetyltransferase [Pseudomonas syringae pv. actinidiae]|nr:GNAT family N-acetyltransferase [Pseudomonas syringae pv. actinidiae]
MITSFIEKIDSNHEWPEMANYIVPFRLQAIDHHGIVAVDMKATIIKARDASEQIPNHPRHQDVGRALFLIKPDMDKAAKCLFDVGSKKLKHKENVLFVNSIEVDDECRGRGYGTLVMRQLAKYQNEAPLIVLRASPFLRDLEDIPIREHKRAHDQIRKFYVKLGFERIGLDVYAMQTKDLAFDVKVQRRKSAEMSGPR